MVKERLGIFWIMIHLDERGDIVGQVFEHANAVGIEVAQRDDDGELVSTRDDSLRHLVFVGQVGFTAGGIDLDREIAGDVVDSAGPCRGLRRAPRWRKADRPCDRA